MRTSTMARITRMIFLSWLFCGMVHQALYSQTNSVSDQAVTNRFYSSAGKWVSTSKPVCLVWSSFPRDGESVTWSGGITNGKACGKGTLQWFTNGIPTTAYEGEMKDGLYDGHGISQIVTNRASWEGDWEKGSLVSKTMTCHYSTGGWYKGEQKGGFKDGQGEESMVGGDYVGQFKHDLFEGQGVMTLVDGGKISGQWSKSKLVGVGTYVNSSGETVKVRVTANGMERVN